jgi:endonuclease III
MPPVTTNKQQLLDRSLKLLEKKFPVPPEPDKRPVMEELLYAICREGVPTAQADAAFKRLKDAFFDWNEVRVSTVPEVADALAGLPDAGGRAQRVVEFLQELFEMTYSFSLEDLEKKGLKQAAKQLARYQAVTDFGVAWVTQRSLGGHALPLDEPTLRVVRRLRVVDEGEEDTEALRGTLEHYVPKARGHEFTELFVQHAAAICTDVPQCPVCPLNKDCPTGIEILAKKPEPKPKPKSR